jgi:hypothetical protein
VSIRNENAKDAQWKIHGSRRTVYAKAALSYKEQVEAVRKLAP